MYDLKTKKKNSFAQEWDARSSFSTSLRRTRSGERNSRPPGYYNLAPVLRDSPPRARIARILGLTMKRKRYAVSVRMPAYRDRFLRSNDSPGGDGGISGTQTRTRARSRTFMLLQPRLANRLDRSRERRPQLWMLRRRASGELGPSPLPLSRSRSPSARALSVSLLLDLSPVSNSSKEPPAGTSTASSITHQMARSLAH